MNWKMMLVVMSLLNEVAMALSDGKLTADEATAFIQTVLKMFNIDLGFGDLFTFESKDGDLYIVIKRQLMEKISKAM